jgi:hypothetical protein
MPVYKNYTTEQYTTWLQQPFSNNYGISENTIADWFMGQNGSYAVRHSYGVTRENLLNTYIPKLKELLGGYVFFLCYTVTEAGGAGNWINHYASDTSSTGLGCLIDDCNYLLKINNENHPPSMSAPEVFAPAVEDVPGTIQKVYNECPNNSIGKVFIPSTMAGNAWVYATKWCTANQGAVPYVYFGNPYDSIIATIKSLGADPFKKGEQKATEQTQENQKKEPSRNDQKGDLISEILQILENIKKGVLELFDYDVTLRTPIHQIYTNEILTVERTYNNSMKISVNDEVIDNLMKSFESLINPPNQPQIKFNQVPKKQQKDAPKGDGKTNITEKVNALRSLNGQKIGDGYCYALTSWYVNSISPGYHISYSLGRPPAGFLIGDGLHAYAIGSGWNWAAIGWKVKTVSESNLKVGDIFNVGAYVGGVWQTGEYGHTGIVTGLGGGMVEVTDQNYLGYPVNIRQYPIGQFLQGLTSLISPP